MIQPTRHNHHPSKCFGTHITEKPPRCLVRIVFLVGHGTKWTKSANIWPKIAKNAYFGPNLAVFGPKILILMGESKSFGTHITEKPTTHLVPIVFWSGMAANGPKMSIFGPN